MVLAKITQEHSRKVVITVFKKLKKYAKVSTDHRKEIGGGSRIKVC